MPINISHYVRSQDSPIARRRISIYHGKVAVAVANHMLKIGLALLHHNDIYCTAKEDGYKKLKAKLAGYRLSALVPYLPQ